MNSSRALLQRCILILILVVPAVFPTEAQTQSVHGAESVHPIATPLHPLPSEDASSNITKFSFIAYGDTRGRRDGRELQYEHSLVVDAMIACIKKLDTTAFPVRFVLQTGDAVVNGGDARQWNTSFVELVNRITRDGGVPYYLAPGNHDVTTATELESPDRQKGLRNYLSAISQLIPPEGAPRRLTGYPTYAFGYGNAFFFAFDSNIAADEKQFGWVRNQLETLDRHRYSLVVVFCHHPAFSSGPHGGARVEIPTAEIRRRYMPLFRKHHVRMVFSGHDHLFEHWVERYEGAGKRFRLDQVVTGGGGAPLYHYTGTPDLEEYLKSNASEKVTLEQIAKPGVEPGENVYHFVLVKVNGENVDLEVRGVDWGRDFQPYRGKKMRLQDDTVE
jgi:3',5'-cyclic AMP phosphodiesterase CpdA